jgi:hypothetical protein
MIEIETPPTDCSGEGVSIAITLKRVYFLPQPQLQLYLHLLQSHPPAQLQFPSPVLQEQLVLPFPMPTIFSMK